MSRAHSGKLPLYIYALALSALTLIVLAASFFVSQSHSLLSNGEGANTQGKNNFAQISVAPVTELELKSRLSSESETKTSDENAHQLDMTNEKVALQETETAVEHPTRQAKKPLGFEVRKNAEAAVIVSLLKGESCVTRKDEKTSLAIYYRLQSPTIRSSSFNELRSLLKQFRRCENSEFHMTQGDVESSDGLVKMRFNELKYFFTQHSVPKSALHYSEFL